MKNLIAICEGRIGRKNYFLGSMLFLIPTLLVGYLYPNANILFLLTALTIPLTVRRLHDLNLPGHLWVVSYLSIINTDLILVSSIFNILLYIIKGEKVANKYGDIPNNKSLFEDLLNKKDTNIKLVQKKDLKINYELVISLLIFFSLNITYAYLDIIIYQYPKLSLLIGSFIASFLVSSIFFISSGIIIYYIYSLIVKRNRDIYRKILLMSLFGATVILMTINGLAIIRGYINTANNPILFLFLIPSIFILYDMNFKSRINE